ncbi:MAG: hypothetical protein AMJ93_13350 [Anaerolineae bacterium SM23_84]|nr:MAG: hypothetical protein AMJ93_13350 [Anaerolineae bacterium SM23_84]
MTSSWFRNISQALQGIGANQRIRRWVSASVLLCTVGFLVLMLLRSTDELRQYDDWSTYLDVCAKGFLVYPISLITQALIWLMIIMRLGQMTGSWWDVEIYSYSYLMRHLPGMIWYLAGRAAMYRTRGIGAVVTLLASGVEWLLLLTTSVLLYGTLSLTGSGTLLIGILVLSALILATSLGLRQALLASSRLPVPGFVRRRLTALATVSVPSSADLALWLSLYVTSYFIGGGILVLLVHGVAPEVTIGLVTAAKTWALTAGVGFLLTAIVPAGLGIRELTLAALLSPPLSRTGAIVVAILLRIVFVAGDLVWGGMLYAMARFIRHHRHRKCSSSSNDA